MLFVERFEEGAKNDRKKKKKKRNKSKKREKKGCRLTRADATLSLKYAQNSS
jgi:hypothetical protein